MPTSYSHAEIMAMQQDAIRRAQEMQRRSHQQAGSQPETRPADIPQDRQTSSQTSNTMTGSSNNMSNILDSLHLDHDRIMIIALILVLLNEGGDQLLILALCYLLL